ncbi:MAG: GntR family transcriptional regulator [Bradyrhizobium sp.]|nr:GntR family transcriptional regulator [Bradyrhizobium sp.]
MPSPIIGASKRHEVSPLQAMERAYAALKGSLREGAYPPGHRLEANRVADAVGISMTPVRDALNRLVGERMVESSSGEGFHVPRLSEGDLRDLYEWHSALIIMAAQTARTLPAPDQLAAAMASGSLSEASSACFELLADACPNSELRAALLNAGDRLHPFRRIEESLLDPVIGELEEVIVQGPGQRQAIRRYHAVRMRAAPDIIRARWARK